MILLVISNDSDLFSLMLSFLLNIFIPKHVCLLVPWLGHFNQSDASSLRGESCGPLSNPDCFRPFLNGSASLKLVRPF